MSLPEGYEGLVFTGANPPVTNLPIGFAGLVLTFSARTLLIKVINGLGRPVPDVLVTANEGAGTREGFTNEDGNVVLDVDDISVLRFNKEKYFAVRDYDRLSEGANIVYEFQPPILE